MASNRTFPPDVPSDRDEIRDDVETTAEGLRAKAADLAERTSETVKDGLSRAKDAWEDTDPVEMAREGGEAVVRSVREHPLAAFALGALSIGLIAWSGMRSSAPPPSLWQRYQPDYGKWRNLLGDYGNEAAQSGEHALKAGGNWLRSQRDEAADYAARGRDFADLGGRMLARRAEREPLAALLGIGIAVYVVGSLLTSGGEAAAAPARKRTSKR